MRLHPLNYFAVCLSVAAMWSTTLLAEVKTPAVFGSGMVLQRNMDVPVWGWADVGERITVSFRDQTVSATANDQGEWQVKLKPMQVGKAATLAVTGSNNIEFEDVLVGEVWLASGQSNMEWKMSSTSSKESIATDNDDLLRIYISGNITSIKPSTDFAGS